jgi:hypothetical protein
MYDCFFSNEFGQLIMFHTLWKDADPGIAEVEGAGKRVAG